MKPNQPLDEQALHTLMEELPMSQHAPENLRQKLIDIAASPAARHRSRRRPAFALALSAATVVAAVALITSLPATARSWDGIKEAAQNIQTMELTVVDARNGHMRSHTYVARDSIHVQLGTGEFLYVTDKMVRTFDRSDNLVLDVTMPEQGSHPDIRAKVLKELSMATLLGEYERRYGRENIKLGATRQWQGRAVYDATLRDTGSRAHGKLVIDAKSDLPILIEVFEMQDGKVTKTLQMNARFNHEAGSGGFAPDIPKGAKHETKSLAKLIEENGGTMPKLNFSFRRLLRD